VANKVAYFTGVTALSSNTNLHWDNTNSRLGIGTVSPTQAFHVVGDINVSSGQGFRINDTATAATYLRGNGTRFVQSTIQATDVPVLNQNTTGTAANITATSNTTLTTLSNLVSIGTITTGTWNASTIAVNRGGTGQTSYTNGQLLIGNTTGNTLTVGTLTGTSNQVTVTNGAGTITLSLPQNVHTSANFQVNSLGVGTAGSGTAGEIRATNNITAYFSDARLKNFRGVIPDALTKVLHLSGYYFTENDVAKSLGYTNDKIQVGVSAQEVQSVLPEIVVAAPISDKYLTVQYEKLVPLLIEAIKELSAKVDKLQKHVGER